MISVRRILIGLFLGALLVAGLTVTFAQVDPRTSGPAIATRSILRSDLPPMDPEPVNKVTPLYSPAWWQAQREVDKFREKYPEAIVIITPAAIGRPVYAVGEMGAATSMIVTTMFRLPLYADALRRGDVVWCRLRDAFAVLATCDGPTPDHTAEDPAVADAARLRSAIAQAIETLSSATK